MSGLLLGSSCLEREKPVAGLPRVVDLEDRLKSFDYSGLETIPPAATFRNFLPRLIHIFESKRWYDLYDSFSPARVRARLTRHEFHQKAVPILEKNHTDYLLVLRAVYSSLVDGNPPGKTGSADLPVKWTSDSEERQIARVKLPASVGQAPDRIFLFLAKLEGNHWVLEDIVAQDDRPSS